MTVSKTNDYLICALCAHKKIRRFHRFRDLHTHITMAHGRRVRIRIDAHGTIKITGTKIRRLKPPTVLNQA